MKVADASRELRFTRAGQAVKFWVGGAVLFAIGVTWVATAVYRAENPELPHPGWALLFFGVSAGALAVAWHLTRHAYLILTPIGLEIFPFFRPAEGMRMVVWQEIVAADAGGEGTWLSLHFNRERSAGMHLSLKPIRKEARSLLVTAVTGRVGRD